MGHWPGRIYLLVLLFSIIGMAVLVSQGITETPEGGEPFLLFGWMTMPLVLGIGFVLLWFVSYLIYFFKYWPYR